MEIIDSSQENLVREELSSQHERLRIQLEEGYFLAGKEKSEKKIIEVLQNLFSEIDSENILSGLKFGEKRKELIARHLILSPTNLCESIESEYCEEYPILLGFDLAMDWLLAQKKFEKPSYGFIYADEDTQKRYIMQVIEIHSTRGANDPKYKAISLLKKAMES